MTKMPPLAGGGGYTISLEDKRASAHQERERSLAGGGVGRTHLTTGPEKVG